MFLQKRTTLEKLLHNSGLSNMVLFRISERSTVIDTPDKNIMMKGDLKKKEFSQILKSVKSITKS